MIPYSQFLLCSNIAYHSVMKFMAFSFALSMNTIKETAHAKRNVPTQLKSTVPTTYIELMGVTLPRKTHAFSKRLLKYECIYDTMYEYIHTYRHKRLCLYVWSQLCVQHINLGLVRLTPIMI